MCHAAVEAVQDALMEQARAQEENMQLAYDDLMASFEKGVDYRLSAVKDEVGYRPVIKNALSTDYAQTNCSDLAQGCVCRSSPESFTGTGSVANAEPTEVFVSRQSGRELFYADGIFFNAESLSVVHETSTENRSHHPCCRAARALHGKRSKC